MNSIAIRNYSRARHCATSKQIFPHPLLCSFSINIACTNQEVNVKSKLRTRNLRICLWLNCLFFSDLSEYIVTGMPFDYHKFFFLAAILMYYLLRLRSLLSATKRLLYARIQSNHRKASWTIYPRSLSFQARSMDDNTIGEQHTPNPTVVKIVIMK